MTAPIALESYACNGSSRLAEPLVLLHGWGNDSRVWGPLLAELSPHFEVITVDLPGFGRSRPCHSWQQVVDDLAAALPEKFSLMGWSLGGMLATQLACRYPSRVEKLITLASNASFVSRSGWKTSMPAAVFDDFYQGFVADPERCIKQFGGLEAKGDSNDRELIKWLRANSAEIFPSPWLTALDWLKAMDNRQTLAKLTQPSLHLFGANDQLVPVAAASHVAKLSKRLEVKVIEQAGHAPHISQPQKIAELVTGFLVGEIGDKAVEADRYRLQKERIASSFGKAAESYDSVAQLQREVGDKLIASLELATVPTPVAAVADMGCGTGHFSVDLARRFPQACCTGIDLAPGMISYAARHHGALENIRWLCGDAENLPLGDESFDLVFSNFAFQWCQNLAALMKEQWRVLRPGGVLAFTTVGPESLCQLREAWQRVDSYVHVNQFTPLQEVSSTLADSGFRILHWQEEMVVRHYDALGGLTRELKALGAHNVNQGCNSGLTGRKRVEALKAAYEVFREERGLPASWQMLYVVATKSAIKSTIKPTKERV